MCQAGLQLQWRTQLSWNHIQTADILLYLWRLCEWSSFLKSIIISIKQNHMNQICTCSCGEWSNRATTVRVREYSINCLRSYIHLLVHNFHPCLFLRLWDKLSQALSRSGGIRMLEETEKHIWVLPMHPCTWLQDQGQQLRYVRSSSGTKSDSLIEK